MRRPKAKREQSIRVRGLVPAPRDPLRAFVADLQTQRTVAPLARTRLTGVEIDPTGDVIASFELGRRVELRLTWSFQELRAATGVEVAASLPSASPAVRALLLAGGGRWMKRRLSRALSALAEVARVAAAAGAFSGAQRCEQGLCSAAR